MKLVDFLIFIVRKHIFFKLFNFFINVSSNIIVKDCKKNDLKYIIFLLQNSIDMSGNSFLYLAFLYVNIYKNLFFVEAGFRCTVMFLLEKKLRSAISLSFMNPRVESSPVCPAQLASLYQIIYTLVKVILVDIDKPPA